MRGARAILWTIAALAAASPAVFATRNSAPPTATTSVKRATADPPAIGSSAATAEATAERLDPPVRRPQSLVVVGDSLSFMAGYSYNTGTITLAETLLRAGWSSVHIDAKPSRSMWYLGDHSFSGVHSVERLRATGHAPDAWLVQLGTNDVWFIERCRCADMAAFARQRILAVLDAIGEGTPVFWVNVRRWSNTAALVAVNDALLQLHHDGRIVAVVDWHGLSSGRRATWFVDSAHLSHAGYQAWLAEISRVVRDNG